MSTKSKQALASSDVIRASLKHRNANAALNVAGRVLLMVFALGTASVAAVLVYLRADEIIKALTDGDDALWSELLALTAPVLLLLVLAGLAVIVGFLAHSRDLDESFKTFDSVNRLRREDEVAVSARGLVVAFESQLAAVKRAHGLTLWVGRTLFIVTIGLFVACAIRTLAEGVDPTTAILGATSLTGALLGAATKVPTRIAHEAANVVQLQLIVTGAHRQIGMLESDAFASLNNKETPRADAHRMVLEIQQRIEDVVDMATKQVEGYADPEPEAEVVKFPQRPTRAAA